MGIPKVNDFAVPTPKVSCQEKNEQFLKEKCASWLARVIHYGVRLEGSALELIFWLAEGRGAGEARVLDILVSGKNRERFLPDISRCRGDREALVSLVDGVIRNRGSEHRRKENRDLSLVLETWANSGRAQSSLERHLESTKRLFGLTDSEIQLAFFFGALQWWQPINKYFDRTLSCDIPMNRNLLGAILGQSQEELSRVLTGKLFRIGIMDPGPPYMSLESEFLPYFTSPGSEQVRSGIFRRGGKPELQLGDLGLPVSELGILKTLFSHTGGTPIHVLVHGIPGTGKSSLWKALVAEMGLKGIEVLGTGKTNQIGRGAALAACVEIVGESENSVVVIDEAESLLVSESSVELGRKALEKAWLNDLMERPGLRCIWVVNSTEEMDPATLRRFTYSIEMKPLQGKRRVAMVEAVLRRNRLKRHFQGKHIQSLALDFDLAPAVFDSSAKAAKMSRGGSAHVRQFYRQTLQAKARLLGKGVGCPSRRHKRTFLPAAVNMDPGFDRIRSLITRQKKRLEDESAEGPLSLNFLFFGIPGTGKSFTARHFAQDQDLPVVHVKASDWLDTFVGGTERKMAMAFLEAGDQGAILIVDEIDTFLQKRRADGKTWETSMVNELLTQMEEFQGILIGTTNRMSSMDPAALRRFSQKVEFSSLAGDQVVRVYQQAFKGIASGPFTRRDKEALGRLVGTTASDIYLVRENASLQGESTPHEELISGIEREVACRQGKERGHAIGFQ